MLPGRRFALIALAYLQLQPPSIFQIGEAADKLTQTDIAAIQTLARPDCGQIWVLNATRGQFADMRFVEVFCVPDSSSDALRRGNMIWVDSTAGKDWRVSQHLRYAQVTRQGRRADEILGNQDLNRPFRLIGLLSDTDILGISALLRSESKVKRDWPVTALIAKDDGTVTVHLREDDLSGQRVILRRDGATWQVVSVNFVIA